MSYFFSKTAGKKKLPPTVALTNGSSVDKAIGASWENKIKTNEDLPFDKIVEVYMKEMERRLPKTQILPTDVPASTMKTTIKSMRLYYDRFMPDIFPIEIQKRVKIDFGGVIVTGFKDCEEIERIRDLKTTARGIKLEYTHDYQNQLSIYNEEKEKELFIDAIHTIGLGQAKVIPIEYDRLQALRDLVTAADIIREEKYEPNRDSPLCTRRWCQHWQTCEEMLGGKVKP